MRIELTDRVGLIRPSVDAHTLGVSSIARLLTDCGIRCVVADAIVCDAAAYPKAGRNSKILKDWFSINHITILGYSYRLNPEDGVELIDRFLSFMKAEKVWKRDRGTVAHMFFAGLPPTCELVKRRFRQVEGFFEGDESPYESLRILGISERRIPSSVVADTKYDEERMRFGRELINKADYKNLPAPPKGGYPEFGNTNDGLLARLKHRAEQDLPPLMRAHVGPYLPEREAAVDLFVDWAKTLAKTGYLDILSIGTSQLSQEDFFGDWTDRRDGGGVPIHFPSEFQRVWEASRPMLVRTYAGTKDMLRLAELYEETIHAAWHTMSFWWFSKIDGRGHNNVLENLVEHANVARFVASAGKPFEPNVPHHFSFRGADDVSYVVAGFVAAKVAKLAGIQTLVLQVMLNTPKYTWGIQDLAKARALLRLVRSLEDSRFRVILQPRGGLDYFSPKEEKAKAQLAAVTALMDDIEPNRISSPDIIHVVSYSEGFRLADPSIVNESIQITLQALTRYRELRRRGLMEDMSLHEESKIRTEELLVEARAMIQTIERYIPNPYSPLGMYDMFRAGFFPVPYLWECREEFKDAVKWNTSVVQGAVRVVDIDGKPISTRERMLMMTETLKARSKNDVAK